MEREIDINLILLVSPLEGVQMVLNFLLFGGTRGSPLGSWDALGGWSGHSSLV